MEMNMDITGIAKHAKNASRHLAAVPGEQKNLALKAIIEALENHRDAIFSANLRDLERSREEGLAQPLIKRLKFQEEKLSEVITGISALISIPDPIGQVMNARELSEGLNLYQVRCPIGVLAMIFESRPDAAVQIASLALKSGNAVLLKGGSEARETVGILARIIHDAATEAGIPSGWLGTLEDREAVREILGLDRYIDLIIPRGSNEFVQYIMNNSSIPVMGHADGICHLYIDSQADLDMAVELAYDSKTQYVAVCNAMETLLVDRSIASDFLPKMAERMAEKAVEIRGCNETLRILPSAKKATDDDWSTEYLDYILSVKIVGGLSEAVEHINRYGSGHTDGIVTRDRRVAEVFLNSVDTASALWNCSTRFADGYRYGLGAEVGISTHKIHARGPVGMDGLTIYQWRVLGSGQMVGEFADGTRTFTHREIPSDGYPFGTS
jgi:glutamate-5-semialdehyde dehydrogenase